MNYGFFDEKNKEYEEKYMNPYIAASRGYIDAIIKPEEYSQKGNE